MTDFGTGVLGGGGRIPLAKSDDYGFDGRITPRLFHKPKLGPKRPRIKRGFYLGSASLHGSNMRGLTAKQIAGGATFGKLEKSDYMSKTIAMHAAKVVSHLARAKEAAEAGNHYTAEHHTMMAKMHQDIVDKLSTPQDFGKFDEWMDLSKKFDASKHPREYSGEFAGKPAEKTSRFAGGAAGAVGGYVIGTKHGRDIGSKIGMKATKLYHSAETAVSGKKPNWHTYVRHEMNEVHNAGIGARIGEAHGAKIGGVVLGTVGAMAGAEIGHHLDSFLRRRRAIKAGKLDQYNRLNSGVSTRPNSVKQLKATAGRAKSAANKVGQAHQFVSQFSKFDEWIDLSKAVAERSDKSTKRLLAENAAITGAGTLAVSGIRYSGHMKSSKFYGKKAAEFRTNNPDTYEVEKEKRLDLSAKLEGKADEQHKQAGKTIVGKIINTTGKASTGLRAKFSRAKFVGNAVKAAKFVPHGGFLKSDGLNSISRKSLVELAKDMGDAGVTSAATSVFDRAFGVPGQSNPQVVAHVNPGNHFASGWHFANGTPPAAPVATL